MHCNLSTFCCQQITSEQYSILCGPMKCLRMVNLSQLYKHLNWLTKKQLQWLSWDILIFSSLLTTKRLIKIRYFLLLFPINLLRIKKKLQRKNIFLEFSPFDIFSVFKLKYFYCLKMHWPTYLDLWGGKSGLKIGR